MTEDVIDRMADLMCAAAAADAFRREDRQGVVEAMQAITPGRSGEALLALTVLAMDQAARATDQPWEAIRDVIMTALMDPDEHEHIQNRPDFKEPS